MNSKKTSIIVYRLRKTFVKNAFVETFVDDYWPEELVDKHYIHQEVLLSTFFRFNGIKYLRILDSKFVDQMIENLVGETDSLATIEVKEIKEVERAPGGYRYYNCGTTKIGKYIPIEKGKAVFEKYSKIIREHEFQEKEGGKK